MLDVIQISYHEEFADENFNILKQHAPFARQVKGVTGIFEAHKAAAELAETNSFYVIDADAIVEEEFSFKFSPNATRFEYEHIPQTECVYTWRSRNPINDLLYGYGGVKLFPRRALLKAESWNVDMTTTIGCVFVPKFQVSNITAFNTDPFNTWKSAFRECVKLASSIIPHGNNLDNQYRLDTWCTKGEKRPYGEYCIAGANAGKEYGDQHRDDIKMLGKINDFEWLQEQFEGVSC